MDISLWARRSVLAAGLMTASGVWAATTHDLMVNHDAFQVVAGVEEGENGTGTAEVDGPVGGTFVYRAKPKINSDSGSVSNAILTQKLPSGAIFEGVKAPDGVTCTPLLAAGTVVTDADRLTCTLPTLTPVEQHIDFKVVLPTSGTEHIAFATITAEGNTDTNGDNHNNIPRNITTYERADLAVLFTGPAADSTHQQGDVVDYKIQVSNTNSEYAFPLKAGEKATVRFSLPAGTAFHGSPSSPGNAWACTRGEDDTASPPVSVYDCTYTAPSGGVDTGTDLPLLTIPVVVEAAGGDATALVSVMGKTSGDVAFVDAYPDNNSGEVSINFEPNTQLDMKLVKIVSPTTVDSKNAEEEVTYTLKATRNSGGMMPGLPIQIVDTLPTNITFHSDVTGTGWSCEANGQEVTCDFDEASAIDSDGNLPTLAFKAKVAASSVGLTGGQAVLTNKATLTVANEPEANRDNNNTSGADLIVSNRANLAIEKTASVQVIAQGQEFSYTIGVKNNGPLDVLAATQTITVTDVLDAQLEYVGTELPWSCSAAPDTWTPGNAQTVTCTLDDGIEADESENLVIKVKAHLDGGAGQWATIGNEATVACPADRHCEGWTDGQKLTNNPKVNVSDKVADLSITKEAAIIQDSSTYGANASGAEVVYTLKVKNAVPDGKVAGDFQTAKTVVVTDTITSLLNNNVSADPHPVTGTPRYDNNRFVEATVDENNFPNGMAASACTYSNFERHTTTVTCELQNVPVSDEEYTILIKARQYVNPASGGSQENTIENVAKVSSPDTAEFDVENNTDDHFVTLTALTNMKAQKQASVDTAAAGQKIEYTLTATNEGPSQATGVRVVDTLPVDMIWVTVPSFGSSVGSPSCSLSGGATIEPGLVITADNNILTCAWGAAGFPGGTGATTRDVKYALRSPNQGYAPSVTNEAQVETDTQETIPLSDPETDNKASKIVSFNEPKLNVLINMGHTKDGLPINKGDESKTLYTITVTNSGVSTSYAQNVVMFDHFPAEGSTAVFESASIESVKLKSGTNRFSPDNCKFVNDPKTGLKCEFDWLAPGESVDIQFYMTATVIDNGDIPVGTITHEAQVSADGERLDGADVEADNYVTDRTSAYDSGQITPEEYEKLRFVDLSIKKTSSVTSPEGEAKDAAEVGDTIRYTLVVTNEEQVGSERNLVSGNAVVSDVLPEGLEFVGSESTECTWNAPELRCVITDLVAGASTDFEFDVKVTQLSYGQRSIKNTATVDSPGDDNLGNNEDPEETPSVPPLNPAPVPVDNPLALLALILGMGWIARRFHMRNHV